MNCEQLRAILLKHAPKMSLYESEEILKEWGEMREALGKYELNMLHALKMLGVNSSGYPTKIIEGDDNDYQALWNMIRVHSGFSCGIPGLEQSLINLHRRYPANGSNVQEVKVLMSLIKNKEQ